MRRPKSDRWRSWRCALALDPVLEALSEIIKDKKHAQRLAAIREVLERNDLHGFGVTRPDPTAGQQITINTQVNVPEVRVASLPDQKLATRKLLQSPEPHRQRSSPCRMIRCTEITARRCGGGLYGP